MERIEKIHETVKDFIKEVGNIQSDNISITNELIQETYNYGNSAADYTFNVIIPIYFESDIGIIKSDNYSNIGALAAVTFNLLIHIAENVIIKERNKVKIITWISEYLDDEEHQNIIKNFEEKLIKLY